jgi:hypothetical protein
MCMYSYILNYFKTTHFTTKPVFDVGVARACAIGAYIAKTLEDQPPISSVNIGLIISKSICVQVDIGQRPRIVNQVGMCRSVNLYICMKRGHLLCETLHVLMLGITSCTHTSGTNHKLCFNMYTVVNHVLKRNIHAKIA